MQDRVKSLYRDLLRSTVPPERWDYIPESTTHILNIPDVVCYTDADYGTASNAPEPESSGLDRIIIAFAEKLMQKTDRHLAHIIEASHPSASLWRDDGIERLGLATAVFTARQQGPKGWTDNLVLVGHGEAARHGPCTRLLQEGVLSTVPKDDLSFCRTAYDTIVLLLRLLGMDPNTTLASELDSLQKRFVCMSCEFWSDFRGVQGRRTMDWRECVLPYP